MMTVQSMEEATRSPHLWQCDLLDDPPRLGTGDFDRGRPGPFGGEQQPTELPAAPRARERVDTLERLAGEQPRVAGLEPHEDGGGLAGPDPLGQGGGQVAVVGHDGLDLMEASALRLDLQLREGERGELAGQLLEEG